MVLLSTKIVMGVGAVLLLIMVGLAGGGFGTVLLNPLWTWYFRDREYYADNFVAVHCGPEITKELIDALEQWQFFDVAVPFFLGSHPYTELRIDELMPYVEQG